MSTKRKATSKTNKPAVKLSVKPIDAETISAIGAFLLMKYGNAGTQGLVLASSASESLPPALPATWILEDDLDTTFELRTAADVSTAAD